MYITQGLKRAVQISANGIATINGNRQRTWLEFSQRIAQLSGAFQKLGLSPGGRVAILSFNSDRYLEAYYAVPWANGVIVPLNVRLAPPELIFMLNDSGSEILIIDENFKAMLAAFASQLTTVKHIIYAGEGIAPGKTFDYETLLADASAITDAERGGDKVAGIFYTGGTTGRPKGVMLTHDNIVINAMSWTMGVQYNDETVYLHSSPMFHLGDGQANCEVTMMAGTHAFVPRFDPQGVLEAIQNYKVTCCTLVSTMVNLLANYPNVRNYDLTSLKTIIYGAAPMPEAVFVKAKGVFPNVNFIQGYGMTETAPGIAILEDKYHAFEGPLAGKVSSVGQPLYSLEIKIVAPDDTELPRGVVGEIIVRGPNVMKGYWNRPEETAHALRNGWMHTGDACYMDEDGFLFLVDRYKDMIKSGGENVFSIEVENAIYQHPAVSMCAVIGIPDEKWGETVHALVVLKPDQAVTEQAIIQHCRSLIAGYKCPRSVEFRQEPLPISGAGKIMKAKLREPYWQDRERRIA
ncbi:MAG: long-chain-fatty-acid--CoA ligase [Caldilineaceae bacterium]